MGSNLCAVVGGSHRFRWETTTTLRRGRRDDSEHVYPPSGRFCSGGLFTEYPRFHAAINTSPTSATQP